MTCRCIENLELKIMITKINKQCLTGLALVTCHLSLITCLLLLASCHNVKVPEQFTDVKQLPRIYPDYTDVTIPVNIAPLTFELEDACDEVVARFTAGDYEIVCGGDAVQPDVDQWRTLVGKAANGPRNASLSPGERSLVNVEVFARSGDAWQRYQPFHITVSPDSIDAYISYRLISPSYVAYEELTLNQRCLENYDEQVMVNNMLCSEEIKGQCVNCHNYQQYNPRRMQFHARQFHGGTVIAYDGKLRKVNMRNDSILSAGVYPAWHPWLPLIVYSTNTTRQSFHTRNANRIEVYDSESDLIAYDVDRNEVTNLENDTTEFEVFPVWAPDGKTLYYCSAHFEFRDTTNHISQVISRYQDIKYNIYKKSFNPDTYQFGPRELVFRADSVAGGMSATLPRISPDGRYLMFTMGRYGVFHIWHREADLYLLDLASGQVRAMDEINSPETESYHAWSSNGRWVVFSSRRDDGSYTRPFFTHIDAGGRGSKPFELPQADPDYHRQFLRCYNIPEFMRGPVEVTPQSFARVLKASDGTPVKYVPSLRKPGM